MITYQKNFKWMLVLLFTMGISYVNQAVAQQKTVRVKVIAKDDGNEIKIDTTIVEENVLVFDFDDKMKKINIDSIVHSHTKDMDKMMKVMAIRMDSLKDMDFNFEFDGDMEELRMKMEKMLSDNEMNIECLEKMKEAGSHKVIFIGDGKEGADNMVNVESFVDENGNHVKVVKKRITGDRNSDTDENIVVVTGGKGGEPMRWHSKTNSMTVNIESIPMEELAFLKKLGYSKKMLLNEALKVEEFKVKIEKKIENELRQTLLEIECVLPEEGSYEMQMIKKDGEVKEKSEAIPSGELKKEFEVKEEEAPYYLILTKNNQLFGRKISL